MPAIEDKPVKICTVETSEGIIMVPYVVKRSRRARHIRLSLNGGHHALLTVPYRAREKDALLFLHEQGDWLNKHYFRIKRQDSLMSYLEKKPYLSALGRRYSIHLGFTKGESELTRDESEEKFRLRINASDPVEAQIIALLKKFAKEVIRQRALEIAGKERLRVDRVTVRDQISCWGSCSDRRTVSLNWRLVLLPPELHDYIIYHELAHLTHMNHSEKFWRLLQKYDPRAVRHDLRISRMSQEVLMLGRS